MKKLFYLVLAAVLFAVGCSESFDDSKIWDKLDDHESRISQLEELCKQMNTNISSLQTLVNALNQKEFITNVAPISKNGEEIGYTITFTGGKTITIYHGQDGADGKDGINGENGADGKDGKDGLTPIIGVKLFNGVYYWTLNGEWLLDDDGNKIKAVGTDGKDGEDGKDGQDGEDGKDGQDGNDGATGPQGPQGPAGENGADGEDGKDGQNGADGKDGITPQLKIEEGYWYISYDNGSSWKQLGKATGENGKDGQDGADGKDGKDGDSFFQSVTQDDEYVYFTLADGTQISILKASAISSIEMSYVPRYDDGKATVVFTTAEDSSIEMDFQIMPKSATAIIAKDWQTTLSLKAVETQTRAVEYIDMPISKCTADATNGTITITASGKNLPQTFFDAETKVRAALFYENSIGGAVSEYVELTVYNDFTTPETNNNKIFYTTTTGEKIFPYTTEPAVFGAILISNIYENGQGVLTFDDAITSIGHQAFCNCSSLTSVTIPDSVTTIGGSAFYKCSSLTSITIPDSVTEIGYCAFEGCKSLTSITIPDSVTSIAGYAFNNCSSLTSITIPDSVTTIEYRAFSYCSSLTTAVIGSGVKKIGYSAFENCTLLNEIICKPTTPPTGGSNMFNAIGTSAKIYVPYESVEAYRTADYWKDYANYIVAYDFDKGEIVPESRNNQIFYTATAKIEVKKAEDFGANCISNEWDSTTGEGVMTFDADVTKVGEGAFSWRTKLTSVTLPSSVKTIETYAFSNCNVLKNVNIPDEVTAIGNEAFINCYRLEQISLPEGLKSIGEYAFNKCTDLTAVVIPNSVTSIGQCAFLDCDSLTNATLGSGIKEISRGLFGGTCLHSINIPNGVTTIAREAFISCWRLTSVTIPDSVEYIGQESFASCNNMQSVTIGSGVTTIMDSAFEYCSRLKEVFCKPTTPPILGYCVFDSNASDRKIYVPESANDVVIDAYKSAKNWDSYTDVIVEKAM